jgi:hypothetical protein
MPLLILLTLFVILTSGISTIPFAIGLLVISTVLSKKSWVFFLALGLGLFLDLITIRSLGYASLAFTIFVFTLFLYERKFETQTTAFVFFSAFLGSAIYLIIFRNQSIFLQSLVSSLLTTLIFKIIQNSKVKSQNFK